MSNYFWQLIMLPNDASKPSLQQPCSDIVLLSIARHKVLAVILRFGAVLDETWSAHTQPTYCTPLLTPPCLPLLAACPLRGQGAPRAAKSPPPRHPRYFQLARGCPTRPPSARAKVRFPLPARAPFHLHRCLRLARALVIMYCDRAVLQHAVSTALRCQLCCRRR